MAKRKKVTLKVMKRSKEHEFLRRLVRRFLEETSGVPFRAIDCNQDAVDRIGEQLAKLSGWRPR